MNTRLSLSDNCSVIDELKAKPIFLQQICEAQKSGDELQVKRVQYKSNSDSKFHIGSNGCLLFRGRMCVPKNSELVQMILNEAHNGIMSVHPRSNKMYHDLKKMYWWQGMKRDIFEFVFKCLICLQVQAEHQPITIPEWKWERVTMDFVLRLPLSLKKKDVIWVIVDCLTKSAHFIPVRMDFSLDRLAELYVSNIVRLHGVPVSIISNRNPRFTSRFWTKLQEALVQNYILVPHSILKLIENPSILEDMLQCCILEFEGNWEKYLPLVEFAYNNSYQSSIKMAPYEALYDLKCRTPLYWTELNEKKMHGVDLACEIAENVKNRTVAYRLALPPELDRIHNVFHMSVLQRYRSDPSHVISPTEVEIQPNMNYSEERLKSWHERQKN
ncbi:DNA/RNA polymerases superfamily protein [Gossypium australe]|uniref:DNA/RNA polymerases superfamily protein n=1 Tax=Gossypium australe TaxID=47621 RepID=A0A5B6WRE9_9ROSI|nr:DNA/RNA polymerases superfamily protein [Gossypium australe]